MWQNTPLLCDLLVAANGKLSDSALGVNGSVVQSVVWRSIVLCAVCLIRSKGWIRKISPGFID